ncbi:MAG: flagellar biosynthetic protein FliO [Buchnera aphidicola (Floraphis choui)]
MDTIFQPTIIETIFSKVETPFFKVIILFLLCCFILKKTIFEQKMIHNSLIKIIEKVSVGSNESIVLLDLKEIRLVVGVTSKNISLLYKLSPIKKDEKTSLVKTISTNNIKKVY